MSQLPFLCSIISNARNYSNTIMRQVALAGARPTLKRIIRDLRRAIPALNECAILASAKVFFPFTTAMPHWTETCSVFGTQARSCSGDGGS